MTRKDPQRLAGSPASPAGTVHPEYPWPDRPYLAELDFDLLEDEVSAPPVEKRGYPDQNSLMLRRQYLFRWAAQAVAIALSEVPDVQRVAQNLVYPPIFPI